MSDENWYSATLRFFIISSSVGKLRAEDSIYLVRAVDFSDAFRKFLALGLKNETTHKNHQGDEIRHRLAAITTLDVIPKQDLDGVEINSMPVFEADPGVTFTTPLDPARSSPTQTI